MRKEMKKEEDRIGEGEALRGEGIGQEWVSSPVRDVRFEEEGVDENQMFNVPIVSGKKQKNLTQNLYYCERQKAEKQSRFTPMINIMIQQQQRQNTPTSLRTPPHKTIQNQNQLTASSIQHQREKNESIKLNLKMLFQMKQKSAKRRQLMQGKLKKINHINQCMYMDLEAAQDKLANDRFEVKELIQQQEHYILSSSREMYHFQKQNTEKSQLKQQKQIELENLKNLIRQYQINDTQLMECKVKNDLEIGKNDKEIFTGSLKLREFRLQTSVLKMQISPLGRVWFSSISYDAEQKKKVLDKDPTIWQKRNRLMTKDEVRQYIIIQLYKSWKQILVRFSSNFIGFQQLLCQHYSQEKIEDIYNYITKDQSFECKSSKNKSYIVFFSPYEQSYVQFCDIIKSIQGLSNEIFHIGNVGINGTNQENIKDVVIDYMFRGQKREKSFWLVRLAELSKETVMNYYPKGDRSVLFKIEVPLAFESISQLSKAEQAYKLLQRFK